MLSFRERHGISTVLHVTLQTALSRISTPNASAASVQQTVDAIRAVAYAAIGDIYRDLEFDLTSIKGAACHEPSRPLLERSTPLADLETLAGQAHPLVENTTRSPELGSRHSYGLDCSLTWPKNGHALEPSTMDRRTVHQSHTELDIFGGSTNLNIHGRSDEHISTSQAACLSPEVLARIFVNLVAPFTPNDDHFRPGHTSNIVRASHVCRSWRAAAFQARFLWTNLHTLSVNEMEHLDELLSRSEPQPVQLLSLQFVTHRKLNFVKTCDALQNHLNRIIRLRIHLNPKQMTVFSAVKKAMRRSRASHLETFRLDFGSTTTLRTESLFEGHAPRLRELVIRRNQLEIFGTGVLEGVTHVELLNDQRYPSTNTLHQVYEKCPSLSHLTLPSPFSDIDDAQRDWALPRLKSLTIRDLISTDSPRANPTLEFLRHRALLNIHVISPHCHTYRYVLAKLDDPHELDISYDGERSASVCVRAADAGLGGAYVRTFSQLDPVDVPKLLESVRFRGLRSVGFSLYASRPDWEDLYSVVGLGAMDRVKVLTLFVPDVSLTAHGSTVDIFTYTWERRRHWKLRGLSCLRFTSRPAELCEEHMTLRRNRSEVQASATASNYESVARPGGAILARDVHKFVREGLDVALPGRICIELDGDAHFVEGGGSTQVNALRMNVGAVNLLSI